MCDKLIWKCPLSEGWSVVVGIPLAVLVYLNGSFFFRYFFTLWSFFDLEKDSVNSKIGAYVRPKLVLHGPRYWESQIRLANKKRQRIKFISQAEYANKSIDNL